MEQLRLGHARVAHQADVDVATDLHAVGTPDAENKREILESILACLKAVRKKIALVLHLLTREESQYSLPLLWIINIAKDLFTDFKKKRRAQFDSFLMCKPYSYL